MQLANWRRNVWTDHNLPRQGQFDLVAVVSAGTPSSTDALCDLKIATMELLLVTLFYFLQIATLGRCGILT